MQKQETAPAGKLLDLEAARERRRYVGLANADWDWRQVKASFALEGIALDERDDERAGRFIAGAATSEQVRQDILREFGLAEQERSGQHFQESPGGPALF